MAEPHQQASADNVGSGVGNSVVNDLMRVYESLTQSSTPQAGVPGASKVLSLAYNNSRVPQSSDALVYQPPAGYSIPPNVLQQQQQTEAKNPPNNSGVVAGPNMIAYQQQQQQQPVVNSGYVPAPMGAFTAGPVPDTNKDGGGHHTQRSGEESYAIKRTPSIASKTSQVSSQNQQQPAADASSDSDKSVGGGRPRRKRKQSQNDGATATANGGGKKSGRGKKSKKEDGRWSKRFTWPEDLHRDFVSAIFDVGLKHSSPSTIMEYMPKHEQITTERIKSHLQKYRLHRVKSKKEFISSYEASLRNFQQHQNNNNATLVSGGAEVAAHLTASSIGSNKAATGMGSKAGDTNNPLAKVSSADQNRKQQQLYQSQNSNDENDSLILPQLTDAEKSSPIGSAMGYLMGLFFSLKQQLIIQRNLEAAGEKAKGSAIFSSSTTAMAPSGSRNSAANNVTAVTSGVEFVDGNMPSPEQNGAGSASMRSNIEVNSMMKREMQNQMAVQNKMRALKQHELNKYKDITMAATPSTLAQDTANHPLPVTAVMDNNNVEGSFAVGVGASEQQTLQQEPQTIGGISTPASIQGAGEIAGTDLSAGTTAAVHTPDGTHNNHLLGIDNPEDFWHADVVDDQLFEFLFNA